MKSIENKSMAYSKSIDTENRASIKCVTRTTRSVSISDLRT